MTASTWLRFALSVLAFALAGGAAAQAYPNKTVRIIVPAQPGGGLDLVGRTVADILTKSLQQTFVVENISGGGGSIAAQTTARAAPDGYTLMVGYVGTHGTNPAIRKVPYDAVRDFTPIAMVGGTRNVLVVQPTLPITDMKSLLEFTRRNAGKLNYATGGIGTLNHLVMEQFRSDAGFESVPAHYRGIAPAINDFLSGTTMMFCPGVAAALPNIRSGKMRPIAVSGLVRHPLLPEVPTFQESGFKGFDGLQWYGIVGPAKLPAAITARLNGEIMAALKVPAVADRLSAEAIEPMPMTPAQFGAYIESEIARWRRLAQERNLKLDD
jgi:tripartite-type tricarboxylate transporter receptor subunit TctC